MVLRVPFERFAETVVSMAGAKRVFAELSNGKLLLTAANPDKGIVVSAETGQGLEKVKKSLEKDGFEVAEGVWAEALGALPNGGSQGNYVAAVAYKSGEPMPGLWMEAFDAPPGEAQVLRAMFDEFCDTGEITDVSFEEFVRLAHPNVVVLSPEEIAAFAEKQQGCD